MKKYIIYGLHLYNEPDNIRYIGITSRSTKQRLTQHLSEARCLRDGKLKGKNCYRTNWILANEDNIGISTLEIFVEKELAAQAEVYYIKGYDELGYSLTNTIYGSSNYKSGYLLSDNARANIRAARLRPEVQQRMREVNTGKVISQEVRDKISATLTGRPGNKKTLEQREHMSVVMRGNKNGKAHFGRVVSQDTRDKLSASLTGRERTAAAIEKHRAAVTGLVRKTYKGEARDFSVHQYSLDGEHMHHWPMITSASKATGVQTANIHKCISGKRKQAGGFVWKKH